MALLNKTYEPFSKQPEYLEVNRCFIHSVLPHLQERRVLVDVACGIGTLTGLLAAELRRQDVASAARAVARAPREGLRVLGVDLSFESLGLAREELAAAGILGCPAACASTPGPALRAIVVQGSGDRLPAAGAVADGLLIGNAIHLFTDKPQLVREVGRVLRPRGVFAFNTAFYAGGRIEKTERFFDTWLKQALRYVKREAARRGEGTDVSSRKRGAGPVGFSNPELSSPEYRALVEGGGFRVLSITERALDMSRSSLEAIGGYAGFATAQLGGYPVELACEALSRMVGPTLEALGLTTVSRFWLEMIAVKR
jgi:ubiquinone/menaquinone biosynthesis C-methylase UbiE